MKVSFQGEMVEAVEVDVLNSYERWNEYQMADGKTLMIKNVLVSVYRIEGRTGPDGYPIYQLNSNQVTRVK